MRRGNLFSILSATQFDAKSTRWWRCTLTYYSKCTETALENIEVRDDHGRDNGAHGCRHHNGAASALGGRGRTDLLLANGGDGGATDRFGLKQDRD
jgi:hypothetical protein